MYHKLRPEASTIKLFTAVIVVVLLQARVFVTAVHFQAMRLPDCSPCWTGRLLAFPPISLGLK
jgi:hypothetical protein